MEHPGSDIPTGETASQQHRPCYTPKGKKDWANFTKTIYKYLLWTGLLK